MESRSHLLACVRITLSNLWTDFLTFVRENSEAVKIALAIAAAMYTAYVYSVEMRDNRVANTLAFQNRATSGHLHDAFKRMDMFWIRGPGLASLAVYRDRRAWIHNKLLGEERNDAATNANKEHAMLTGDLVRYYGLESDIFVIYKFYRDIVVCVEQGRCDRVTACQLFARDVEDFRLVYREFLDEWEYLWGDETLRASLMYFFCDCGTDMLIGPDHPDDDLRRNETERIDQTCNA